MIPRKGFSGFMYRMAGDDLFLRVLGRNILSQLVKTQNGRMHTFLSNNGQTSDGISQNTGHERFYTWQNTLVDCREMPNLMNQASFESFSARLEASSAFVDFQKALAERSGGFLKASIFVKVVQGQKNKRYNIRLDSKSKYEEFDIIRVGLCLQTATPEDFKMGLFHLLNWEKRNHPDYRGIFIMPEKTPA